MTFPAPSEIGIYKFKAVTNYVGGPDLAEDSFEVVAETKPPSPPSGGGSSGESKCTYIWECSDWGDCIDGAQTRTCKNTGTCTGTLGKPIEKITCLENLSEIKVKISKLNLSEDGILSFNMDLTEKKNHEKKDIQVFYSILDKSNTEIFTKSDFLEIETSLSYNKEFEELKLEPGEYTIRVSVLYGHSQKSEDSQSFIVKDLSKEDEEGTSSKLVLELKSTINILNIILIFVILVWITFIVIIILKRKKNYEIDVLIKEGKKYLKEERFDDALDVYPVLKNLYKSKYKGNTKVFAKINEYHELVQKAIKQKIALK